MKKIKKSIFALAALIALSSMALSTGCQKKDTGTEGTSGTTSTPATGTGTGGAVDTGIPGTTGGSGMPGTTGGSGMPGTTGGTVTDGGTAGSTGSGR